MLTEIITIVIFLWIILRLCNIYSRSNDNYWPSIDVVLVKPGEISSVRDRVTAQTTMVNADMEYYRRLKPHRFGGYMELRKPILFIADLDLVKHIMVKDFDSFVNRRSYDLEETDPILNQMLTNLSNNLWKETRYLMSPAFTTGKIRKMFQIFDDSSIKFMNYINKQIPHEGDSVILNIQDLFGSFAIDVVAANAFGLNINAFENPIFLKMARQFHSLSTWRFIIILIFLWSPKFARYCGLPVGDGESINFFRNILKPEIQRRRKLVKSDVNDFLQIIMDTPHPPGLHGSPDDFVMSQCVLFLTAGFDTTESFLTFAAYELAMNPEIQDRLVDEVSEAFEKSENGKLTYDGMDELKYLDMFVHEVLRKYPPAARTERTSNAEYKIPGSDVTIPKGTVVAISMYAIQHDPEIYPDPEKFDPERFSAEEKSKRHPFSFLSFGMGPRHCIGNRFATMEIKVVLAHLVRNFVVDKCSETCTSVKFHPKVAILKPVHGMWLKLTKKNAS